jgi:hypothetical protein
MITVHKYPMPAFPGIHRVEMPRMAEILHVHAQQVAVLCIWARVSAEDDLVSWFFQAVETGKEAPPGRYVGTAHFADGDYVLHVFEMNGS